MVSLILIVQVSFGIHDTEEKAARQYDRALIIEKGRAAKTNFPVIDYLEEVAAYRSYLVEKYESCPTSPEHRTP